MFVLSYYYLVSHLWNIRHEFRLIVNCSVWFNKREESSVSWGENRPGRRREGRKGGDSSCLSNFKERKTGGTKYQRSGSEERNEKTNTREEGKGGKGTSVTQFIELRVHSRRTGDRTDQSGFEEGGPTVDQTPLTADVVLDGDGETRRGREERGKEAQKGDLKGTDALN